jgi:hypothetical protein
MPWGDPSTVGAGYVDIKLHPNLVSDIPECRGRPALADLLLRINASTFRTAKSGVWETTELAEDEQMDFGLPRKVGSYIDLLIDDSARNSHLEPQLALAHRIEESVRDLRVQAQLEISVRRCLFHPDERWGFYLTVFVHAYGRTPREAEDERDRVLRRLTEAWPVIGREFRPCAMDT